MLGRRLGAACQGPALVNQLLLSSEGGGRRELELGSAEGRRGACVRR